MCVKADDTTRFMSESIRKLNLQQLLQFGAEQLPWLTPEQLMDLNPEKVSMLIWQTKDSETRPLLSPSRQRSISRISSHSSNEALTRKSLRQLFQKRPPTPKNEKQASLPRLEIARSNSKALSRELLRQLQHMEHWLLEGLLEVYRRSSSKPN